MQNTKAIKFEEGVAFFSGEDRYLVPGQKVRIGGKVYGLDVEDYSVIYQDELTGAIVVRRKATNGIAVLTRTAMLYRERVAVEYYGIEVDGQMVFPGDVVVVRTNTDAFDATFICAEDDHDLVRIREISTGEIGAVPYDSIELKNADVVEIGEWVRIGRDYYVIAMVEASKWALINVMRGGRFLDAEEDGLGVVDGRWCVPKDVIIGQAEVVRENPEFLGKMKCISEEEQV